MEELLASDNVVKMGILFIVALIALFFIFKNMFRKTHPGLKAFFLSFAVSILLAGLFGVIAYMTENQYIFSNQTKYYVYGKVQEVNKSAKTIRIYASKTSLDDMDKGVVTAKLTDFTVVVELGDGASERKIPLDEIKANDVVQIMCKENKRENNMVTAIKIVKRNE
ncbi:MAG: hypothetical protein PHP54_02885 [Clostridia bacterium]|nr:hypothetical protein [Clostridia bacterium]